MLETVSAAPPDPILGLSEAFQNDDRDEKINLTIGVFRDENGRTPILDCVKRAEEKLLAEESSKGYLGIDGLGVFRDEARKLTVGEAIAPEQVAVFQTPGGTGALRVAADFLSHSFSGTRIWLSNPSWPNHLAIFESSGLDCQRYSYLSDDKKSLNFEAMLDELQKNARAGDVICLHACCHNPTGVDPSPEQWQKIAEVTAKIGLLPLVDFAYHGFAAGLEEDRIGIDSLRAHHQELLVCSSYSKNFGLYSERVGAFFAICPTTDATRNVTSSIKKVVRCNYSNPPRHGGSIVGQVLADSQLKELWLTELQKMRERILGTRQAFVAAMQALECATDFSFLLDQQGMFSFSGLTPVQVDWLRSERAIYIVGSGRINVAGITPKNLAYLTESIAEATRI